MNYEWQSPVTLWLGHLPSNFGKDGAGYSLSVFCSGHLEAYLAFCGFSTPKYCHLLSLLPPSSLATEGGMKRFH